MIMKHSILLFVGMIGIAGLVFSADLRDRGFSIRSTRTDDGITYQEVVAPGGIELTVGAMDRLEDRQLNVLSVIVDTLTSLEYLVARDVKAVFYPDRAEVLIVPTEFVYGGKDLSAYLPSGMQFYYVTHLEYDFRMLVDRLFLRIRGQYFTEEQFADKLLRAAADPAAYLQSQDPEFVVRRFEDIEDSVDELRVDADAHDAVISAIQGRVGRLDAVAEKEAALRAALDSEVDELRGETLDSARRIENTIAHLVRRLDELEDRHVDLGARHELLVADHEGLSERHDRLSREHQDLARRHEELSERHQDLNARHEFLGEAVEDLKLRHEALVSNHADLSRRHDSLLRDFATARAAIIALANEGFLGLRGPTALDDSVVDRILMIAAENPTHTPQAIRDILEEEAVEVSKWEVELVLLVYALPN